MTCIFLMVQVGGLVPGAKLINSPQGLPLQVSYTPVRLSPSFTNLLNQHMVLIWTGKQVCKRSSTLIDMATDLKELGLITNLVLVMAVSG